MRSGKGFFRSFSGANSKKLDYYIIPTLVVDKPDVMRVPKWPFVIFQRNAKCYSCTQTAIHYFAAEYEILQLYSNGHSFFYSEMQNFENCTQMAIRFLQRNTGFWKLYPNGHSYFPQGNTKSNYLSSIFFTFRFLKTGKKKKNMISRYLVAFF